MIESMLYINGSWIPGQSRFEVANKFTGETIGIAHSASRAQVDDAVAAAQSAFLGEEIPIPERYNILMRARDILLRRREEILDTMVAETGFTRADNAGDLARCEQTLLTSAEEAKRIAGKMIPIEASPGHSGELAFTMLMPIGVVACTTPFNSPLNTVAHKIAPAIAAGNSLVLKPASYTPFSSMLLTEIFEEAGLPAGWLNMVTGSGSVIGKAITDNPDVRYFAFTGGNEAGAAIQAAAGMRRTQMELGNISATIICADADLDLASKKSANTAFRKAGQVCTSLQRLYIERSVYDVFTQRFLAEVARMPAGDPEDSDTVVGPMIDSRDAERVEGFITQSKAQGARVLAGGVREGALLHPTVLAEVTPDMPVMCNELFAPVVCLLPFDNLNEALDAVNATPYGLSSGIFTRDIDQALKAARKVEVGLFNINNTSSNRADPMPYGGCKASGWGREGPRAAIRDMTEERLITITPN